MEKEMEIYYNRESSWFELPDNILSHLKNDFTSFSIKTTEISKGKYLHMVHVPKREKEIREVALKKMREIVNNYKTENAALVQKLARHHNL